MSAHHMLRAAAAAVLTLAAGSAAWAAPMAVTALQDAPPLHPSTLVPIIPTAGAAIEARTSFIGQAGAIGSLDMSTMFSEGFESFTAGATPPLNDLFGTGGRIVGGGTVRNVPSPDGDFLGRWNTTRNCAVSKCNWFDANSDFTVEFGRSIQAFGFFGTDFSDFRAGLSLQLMRYATGTTTLEDVTGALLDVSGTPTSPRLPENGDLRFFGFKDPQARYDGARFVFRTVSGSTNTDFFGFDDMFFGDLVGDDGQPPPPGSVPEPGSLALAGLALAGLGWARRRRR